MSSIFDDEQKAFGIVVNEEEQYSIWPTDFPTPLGWRNIGVGGSKSTCLAHIEVVWTDMRPLSLRLAMAKREG